MSNSIFDQRNQKVNNQYNIAGNLNFGNVSSQENAITELKKLLQEINKASLSGVIDAEKSIDVEAKIKKAIVQAEKKEPNKQIILENINGAKMIIESLSSAAGLVGIFMQVIEMIKKVF